MIVGRLEGATVAPYHVSVTLNASCCPAGKLFRLVAGNEIIEAPSCWRARFFEAYAYRRLFKEYFARGAKWTAAPRSELTDELFDEDFRPPAEGEPLRYVINEFGPVFDAAAR